MTDGKMMATQRIRLLLWFVVALVFVSASSVCHAQDIAQVKKGVVKITAQVEGKNRVGS